MAKRWRTGVICAWIFGVAIGNVYAQELGQDQLQTEGQAEALQREAMAESIIAREEATTRRKFDSKYRASVKFALASRSVAELTSISVGVGPLSLGDSAADLVYTPVAPCRIIDTRLAGGAITPGANRNFFAAGSGFSSQGGVAGSCGVPFGPATAVVINFVAVGPAGSGDIRAFAFGSPVPNASIINYANVPGLNIANGIVMTICDPAVSTCTLDLTVQADISATHLVADVVGFFRNVRKAVAVVTQSATFVSSLTSGFTAVSRPITGGYCLTAPGFSPATTVAMAVPEWNNSSGTDLRVHVAATNQTFICAAGQYAVVTTSGSPPVLANNVAFIITLVD